MNVITIELGYNELSETFKICLLYRAIQIIRDTFWPFSDPLPCVTFYFFKCLYLCLEMGKLTSRNLAVKQDFLLSKTILKLSFKKKKKFVWHIVNPLLNVAYYLNDS